VAWQCEVLFAKALPIKHPIPLLTTSLSTPVKLPSGAYGTMPFPTHQQDPIDTDDLFALAAGDLRVYVIGEIVYKDELGNARTTWFCRERGYGEGRFTQTQNPDYESAD